MINIRIYCPQNHKDLETTHNVVTNSFVKYGLDYHIYCITSEEIIYQSRIKMVPHIVINNQVVYSGGCPNYDEMDIILKRMGFIK